MFTPSLMVSPKSSSTNPPGSDLNRRKQREQRFSFPAPLALFAPVESVLVPFISLRLEKWLGVEVHAVGDALVEVQLDHAARIGFRHEVTEVTEISFSCSVTSVCSC